MFGQYLAKYEYERTWRAENVADNIFTKLSKHICAISYFLFPEISDEELDMTIQIQWTDIIIIVPTIDFVNKEGREQNIMIEVKYIWQPVMI